MDTTTDTIRQLDPQTRSLSAELETLRPSKSRFDNSIPHKVDFFCAAVVIPKDQMEFRRIVRHIGTIRLSAQAPSNCEQRVVPGSNNGSARPVYLRVKPDQLRDLLLRCG